jgi:hypothetical protein
MTVVKMQEIENAHWDIQWKDSAGTIDYNKKPLIRELKILGQNSGLNNPEMQQYSFTAILQKTVGKQDTNYNIMGSMAVDAETKRPAQVFVTWHQLAGPKKTMRNMKHSQRKAVITSALQRMALRIDQELGPRRPLPITFTPDGEDEIPSFLRRQ